MSQDRTAIHRAEVRDTEQLERYALKTEAMCSMYYPMGYQYCLKYKTLSEDGTKEKAGEYLVFEVRGDDMAEVPVIYVDAKWGTILYEAG